MLLCDLCPKPSFREFAYELASQVVARLWGWLV
jgi:hypothetical protein